MLLWKFKTNKKLKQIDDTIDYTLASDNPLRFKKNLLETRQKLIMKTGDKIRFDKEKYDVNKEVAEISTLSSGEIDKYKYVINEELLLSIKDKL